MSDRLRIGIVGLGTVGQALIKRIERGAHRRLSRSLQVTAVSARQRDKPRAVDISGYGWCDDPIQIVRRDDVDVVVEVTGGQEMPRLLAEAVIAAGKPWITANKALLAEQGGALIRAAHERQVTVGFEAAVCGAIPAVKTVREAVAGDRLTAIQGIMNGTCNYIFARMGAGESFADALADAQARGYAEADPALDIAGTDAAHKIALLAALAHQQTVDFSRLTIKGIVDAPPKAGAVLDAAGYALKLIAEAQPSVSGWSISVAPCAVGASHPLHRVDGVTNAMLVRTAQSGDILLTGAGAGGEATASAVMADLIDCAENRAVIGGGLPSGDNALELYPASTLLRDHLLYSHGDIGRIPEAESLGQHLYRLPAQACADMSPRLAERGLLDDGGFYLPLV